MDIEQYEYTPKKLTLKEKIREESIWIMLFLFFGFLTVWTTVKLVNEMKYLVSGKKVVADYDKKTVTATFISDEGETVSIDVSDFIIPRGTKDRITLYYIKGQESSAIVMSPFAWWILCYLMSLTFVVWASVMLYRNFRGRKLIKQKHTYDKKQVDSVTAGRSLMENLPLYSKDIYDRHLEAIREDTVKLTKNASPEVPEIVAEHEKLWKVGTVYLAVVKEETPLKNGVCTVVFTIADRYIRDPYGFYETVKANDYMNQKGVYEAQAVIDVSKLPFLGSSNRLYLVLAKPGLCRYALFLPEWYYMKEELEQL